jgi:hypothetical protein
MDVLQAADPDGYPHRLTVFPGLPHNMQGREAEMIPRMTLLARETWPKRVVWKQSARGLHPRFYWLERGEQAIRPHEIYSAHVDGQTIAIETPNHGTLTLRLSDTLLDLDQRVRVVAGGQTVFDGAIPRSFAAVEQSLREREDPSSAASALLPISW